LAVLVIVGGFVACDSRPHDDEDDDDASFGGEGGEAGNSALGGTGGRGGAGASAGTSMMGGDGGSGGTDASGGNAATGGDITSGGTGDVGGSAGTTGLGGDAPGGGSGGSMAGAGNAPSGGSAGSGGSSGSGGNAGTTAGGCGNLIDDMENGTGYICQGSGRTGRWFSYRGTASTLSPAGDPVPTTLLATPRGQSTRGMRMYGTNGDYAGFGCWLNLSPMRFDASSYTGVRFWAMGSPATLNVIVQTSATESTTYGGTCTLGTLVCAGNQATVTLSASAWTEHSVSFDSLGGGTASFDRSDIWSVEFQSPRGSGAYDVWIDDLSFY
jgi:hypothetical protein